MAATVAAYADVMKEVWTADRLEKQFYDKNPFLDRVEKTSRFHTGDKAVVPIHKGRSGGYSVKPAAGGALNGADEQQVDRAEYNYTHHYFEVELESAAIEQTDGKALSVANVIDTEVTGAVADLRKQITRQAFGNGDALIAQCDTTSSSTTIELLSTGYGYDALERGWLYAGLKVDIGTTANEVAIADGVTITSVNESSSDPDIVVSGSAVSTTSSHYVSIKDARSGTTSYEMNGLRTIAGSTSTAIGGLDPDTAGEEFWKPAHVDTTTTALSLDLLLTMQRKVHQKTGGNPTFVITSLAQQQGFYQLLQNQTRFAGEAKLGAGNVGGVSWNGLTVEAQPDVPTRELYMVTIEDLFLVAPPGGPKWMSDIEGAGGRLRWKQGFTSFVDAVAYRPQLACKRRNSHAAAIGLTATVS